MKFDLNRASRDVLEAVSPKRTVAYPKVGLQDDLQRVRDAWEAAQDSRRRNAIFGYLTALFEIGQAWNKEQSLNERAELALQFCFPRTPLVGDPFSLLIVCTSDGVHHRTRSKWSRVLRYALECKKIRESFQDFVRRRGGSINGCALLYTARLRRRGARRRK